MIGLSPVFETRKQLKDYILRNLGYPVVNIELDDTQLEDIINTTLAEFIPFADDGTEKAYKVLELECGKLTYDLPYNVLSVLGLYQSNYLDYSPAPSDLFSINQYMANDMMLGGLGKIDILSLELVQEQISTLGVVFGKRIEYDYNAISKKLYLTSDPRTNLYYNDLSGGNPKFVFMEYYKSIDYDTNPEVKSNLYDVKWVQQYATALARYQWGINMMKYEGSVLPNGMVVNSSAIIDMGQREMESLMEQLRDEWQEPVDFFIG